MVWYCNGFDFVLVHFKLLYAMNLILDQFVLSSFQFLNWKRSPRISTYLALWSVRILQQNRNFLFGLH